MLVEEIVLASFLLGTLALKENTNTAPLGLNAIESKTQYKVNH